MRATYTALHKEHTDIITEGGTITMGGEDLASPAISPIDMADMVEVLISTVERNVTKEKNKRREETGQDGKYDPNTPNQSRVEPDNTADKYQLAMGGGMLPMIASVMLGNIAPEDEERIMERKPKPGNKPGRNNFTRTRALQRTAVVDTNNPYGGYGIPYSPNDLNNYNVANWFMHGNPMNITLLDNMDYVHKLNGPGGEPRSAAALHFYYKDLKYARTMLLDNLQISSDRFTRDGQNYHRFYSDITNRLGKGGEDIWNNAVSVLTEDLLERIQKTVQEKVRTEDPYVSPTIAWDVLFGGKVESGYYSDGEITNIRQANKFIPTTGDQHYYILHEILKALKGTSDNELLTNIIRPRPDIFNSLSKKYEGLLAALNGSANIREGFTRYTGEQGFKFSRLKTMGYRRDDDSKLKYPQGTLSIEYDANESPLDGRSQWITLYLPWTFEDRYFPETLDTERKAWRKLMQDKRNLNMQASPMWH